MSVEARSPILLVRRDPARSMHRFYALQIAPDLLGGWALLREWGRVGSPGRGRAEGRARLPAMVLYLMTGNDSFAPPHDLSEPIVKLR